MCSYITIVNFFFQAAARGVRSPITAERITDWLVDNKVLSIALGGMMCFKIQQVCLMSQSWDNVTEHY